MSYEDDQCHQKAGKFDNVKDTFHSYDWQIIFKQLIISRTGKNVWLAGITDKNVHN